ncbi:hypothetical protein ABEY43_06180 [Priestia megaterium]
MAILTINQLEDYLKKIIMYKVELKVGADKEDGEVFIEVYARDEYYPCVKKGVSTGEKKTFSLTKPYVIYLNEDSTVGYIEHSFGLFTQANKDMVIHLISLIGAKIKLDEKVLDNEKLSN